MSLPPPCDACPAAALACPCLLLSRLPELANKQGWLADHHVTAPAAHKHWARKSGKQSHVAVSHKLIQSGSNNISGSSQACFGQFLK